MALNYLDGVGSHILRQGVPLYNRSHFNSVFIEFMLNETLDLLHCEYVLELHPFLDIGVIFAHVEFGVAFFKNYHDTVGSLGLIVPEELNVRGILDTLQLAPVEVEVGLRCLLWRVEKATVTFEILSCAGPCGNLCEIEGSSAANISHIPGLFDQLYGANRWVFD